MKLAIAQMVLGGLIVTDFAYMTFHTNKFGGQFWLIFKLMTPYLMPYYFAFLVLGFLVLGCGVAQYLKAREARIKHDATP